MNDDFDIEKIRKQIGSVAHQLNWLKSTGRIFPINIPHFEYFEDAFHKLLNLSQVRAEGTLKKKDKRGYWR